MAVDPQIQAVIGRIVATVKFAAHPIILDSAIGQCPGLNHLIGIGPACVILPGEVEMPVAIGSVIEIEINDFLSSLKYSFL